MADWILIGNDHAGPGVKEQIVKLLVSKGYLVKDYGCFDEKSVDYPDYAHAVANGMLEKPGSLGILICGTGNGIAIAANKHPHIRAGIAWNQDIAGILRSHNNANVLVLPGRYISDKEALSCVEKFLSSSFEGGRHTRRIEKIVPV